MHFTPIISALVTITPTLAARAAFPITKRAGETKPDSTLEDTIPKDDFLNMMNKGLKEPESSITYNYDIIHAIAAKLKGPDVDFVRKLSDIKSFEEDGVMSINFKPSYMQDLKPAPPRRGPARINPQKLRGEGVVIYGIDTGIYTKHNCFEGRASWGATFGGYGDEDGNGHGTHTAGTVVCTTYGLATASNIIAIKVLSDKGSGYTSDVISGVQYAYNSYKSNTTKPSIATMSLGGSLSSALDSAVKNAIEGGLHFTVAAGNENKTASSSSPAGVKAANTIGAVDAKKHNQKASFSNYGELIDVWAPGVRITSAWIGSPDAVNTISGTSMATPYVAGVLASVLGEEGQITPQALSQQLKSHAEDKVTFSAEDQAAATSSNHLLVRQW